jgi:hypothetical protein
VMGEEIASEKRRRHGHRMSDQFQASKRRGDSWTSVTTVGIIDLGLG